MPVVSLKSGAKSRSLLVGNEGYYPVGDRGIFAGGSTGSTTNVIDYVTITTTGNATDFGDLSVARTGHSSCSNSHGGL
jgi:FlaG/FlaF family flagellin (archaellin)